MKSINVVIPVKSVSERVAVKNFREFRNGLSLLDHTFKKLRACSQVLDIFISTDHEQLLVDGYEGATVVERPPSLCNNIAPWSSVISHVVESLPLNGDDHLAWAHVTTPLFDEYDQAFEAYLKLVQQNEFNGLVVTRPLTEFIIDAEKRLPLNYAWGAWHPYSQNLRKMLAVTGSLFVSRVQDMLDVGYVISSKPYFYETTELKGLDIDDENDFRLAQILCEVVERGLYD